MIISDSTIQKLAQFGTKADITILLNGESNISQTLLDTIGYDYGICKLSLVQREKLTRFMTTKRKNMSAENAAAKLERIASVNSLLGNLQHLGAEIRKSQVHVNVIDGLRIRTIVQSETSMGLVFVSHEDVDVVEMIVEDVDKWVHERIQSFTCTAEENKLKTICVRAHFEDITKIVEMIVEEFK